MENITGEANNAGIGAVAEVAPERKAKAPKPQKGEREITAKTRFKGTGVNLYPGDTAIVSEEYARELLAAGLIEK